MNDETYDDTYNRAQDTNRSSNHDDEMVTEVTEDAAEVAALRAAIRRLDPLNAPIRGTGRERRRRVPGYRTRAFLGAGLLLLVVSVALNTRNQLPVIELGGGGAVSEANTASDKMAAGAPAMLALWIPELRLADGVDLPAGEGEVYRLDNLDESLLARFAAVLAPDAATEPIPGTEGGGLRSTTQDGSEQYFSISANGSWWYSRSTTAVSCAVAAEPAVIPDADSTGVAVPDDAAVTPGCAPTRRDLPTDETVRRIVNGIVDELGLGNGDVAIEYRDDWNLSVRWDPRIKNITFGNTNPFSLRFGFGEDATIESAGGQYGRLERVGTYPTVGAGDALGTLTASSMALGAPAIAVDCGAPVASPDATSPVDPVSPETSPEGTTAETPTVGEPAVAPCGAPEPATVLVTRVTRIHTLIWDAAGTAWLVPAYEYTTEDGGTWVANALPARYVKQQQTTETAPEPAVVEDGAGTTGAGSSSPGWPGTAGLVGMTVEEAERAARDAGLDTRIVEKNGSPQPGTKDTRLDRVNLTVEDGIVTDVRLG